MVLFLAGKKIMTYPIYTEIRKKIFFLQKVLSPNHNVFVCHFDAISLFVVYDIVTTNLSLRHDKEFCKRFLYR